MTDKEYFVKKMKDENDTREKLAAALGCTLISLSNKINNKQIWQDKELSLIFDRYNWTPVEFISTFISKDIRNIDVLLDIEKVILNKSIG